MTDEMVTPYSAAIFCSASPRCTVYVRLACTAVGAATVVGVAGTGVMVGGASVGGGATDDSAGRCVTSGAASTDACVERAVDVNPCNCASAIAMTPSGTSSANARTKRSGPGRLTLGCCIPASEAQIHNADRVPAAAMRAPVAGHLPHCPGAAHGVAPILRRLRAQAAMPS